MNDIKQLDHLAPIADEMLAGLHADEQMRLRILRAARQQGAQKKRPAGRFVPAAAFAALALVCVGTLTTRLGGEPAATVAPMAIEETAAGEGAQGGVMLLSDLGEGASVRSAKASGGSLFAEGSGDMPLVAVNGAVYRMLLTPLDMGASLLGEKIGSVGVHTDQPSLATSEQMQAGLSNVAGESAAIYAVNGLNRSAAVAAEVDGSMRLFQRVSYAGKGPGGASLEDVFSVRGKVKSLELSGVGELEGEAANEAIAVLLDKATLASADASAKKQFLTVTLNNGLKLQLGVSGDMLCGCGGWSCPEFFEAFEAASQ